MYTAYGKIKELQNGLYLKLFMISNFDFTITKLLVELFYC